MAADEFATREEVQHILCLQEVVDEDLLEGVCVLIRLLHLWVLERLLTQHFFIERVELCDGWTVRGLSYERSMLLTWGGSCLV